VEQRLALLAMTIPVSAQTILPDLRYVSLYRSPSADLSRIIL
jgi:hypothetical protein